MTNAQLSYGSIAIIVLMAVFAYAALGTLGWGISSYSVDGVQCDTEYTFYTGLYKLETNTDIDCQGGSSSSDRTTETFNCDNLSGDQCDMLENSQNAASTAVGGKFYDTCIKF